MLAAVEVDVETVRRRTKQLQLRSTSASNTMLYQESKFQDSHTFPCFGGMTAAYRRSDDRSCDSLFPPFLLDKNIHQCAFIWSLWHQPGALELLQSHRQSGMPSNLPQTFPRRFFHLSLQKIIVRKRVSLADMEGVDADFHRTLTWTT